jgi:antirestriction protein ArdC
VASLSVATTLRSTEKGIKMGKKKPMSNAEIAEIVTASAIEALEAGTVPWQKPWNGYTDGPLSLTTGKAYRGWNNLWLGFVGQGKGYESQFWATFNTISARGGKVKKGEQGEFAIFYKTLNVEDKDQPTDDGGFVSKQIPLLRYFKVFNLDQTEGVEVPERMKPKKLGRPVAVLKGVQAALDAYIDGPEVIHRKGDRAFYTPDDDKITLPQRNQFKSSAFYAETLFHELVHSTGHKSRLDRFKGNESFGCETYAKEELVAEMGAAMLATRNNVKVDWDNTAAYLKSWLGALKDDTQLLLRAATKANAAVDHIMGVEASQDVSEESMQAA